MYSDVSVLEIRVTLTKITNPMGIIQKKKKKKEVHLHVSEAYVFS